MRESEYMSQNGTKTQNACTSLHSLLLRPGKQPNLYRRKLCKTADRLLLRSFAQRKAWCPAKASPLLLQYTSTLLQPTLWQWSQTLVLTSRNNICFAAVTVCFLLSTAIKADSTLCRLKYCCAPTPPCSSAVHSTVRRVLLGTKPGDKYTTTQEKKHTGQYEICFIHADKKI